MKELKAEKRESKLIPLGERILVEVMEVEARTTGGIILTGTMAKEKPNQGRVVANGEMCNFVFEGDIVIFPVHAGVELVHEGKEYLVLRELEVLAKLN